MKALLFPKFVLTHLPFTLQPSLQWTGLPLLFSTPVIGPSDHFIPTYSNLFEKGEKTEVSVSLWQESSLLSALWFPMVCLCKHLWRTLCWQVCVLLVLWRVVCFLLYSQKVSGMAILLASAYVRGTWNVKIVLDK